MNVFFPQLEGAECGESLRGVFGNATFESLILETGYRKPLSQLTMDDKPAIRQTLRAHVILKVKAELDQFCEGLQTCGVLSAVMEHPSLMAPCFLWADVEVTPGAPKVLQHNYYIEHTLSTIIPATV